VTRGDLSRANPTGELLSPAELVVHAVARLAPVVAFVSVVVPAATFSGGALPLALLVTVAWATAISAVLGRMAREWPSPGGFGAWAAEALHPVVGFAVAWAHVFAETLAVALFVVVFAQSSSETLATRAGWPRLPTAIGATVAIGAGLALLAEANLRARVRWAGVLVIAALTAFGVLAVGLLVKARSLPLRPFTPSAALAPDHHGWAGILAGAALAAVAFTGVTGAVPLADETADGGRKLSRTLPASVAVVGVLGVLVAYALVAFSGFRSFAGFPQVGSGHPVEFVAGDLWRGGHVFVAMAIASSAAAGAAAASVSAGRTARFMVERRLLPRAASPALLVIAGVTVTVWLELQFGATAGMDLLAAVVGSVLAAVIGLTMVSALVGPARAGRSGSRHWAMTGVLTGIGLTGAVMAVLASSGWGSRFLWFVRPLPYPVNLAGPAVAMWGALGVVRLAQVRRRDASALRSLRTTRPPPAPPEDPRPGPAG
jgi:amino acid transporter